MRFIGPRLREDRIGRENLKAAFPEKSPEEIEKILAGVWDNLGRIGAEFAHLDHIWDYDINHPEKSRVEIPQRTHELFAQLKNDGKPALIFASHLGNWELPALAAVAHGLDAAILFRRPNSQSADRAIEKIRAVKMGTLIPAGREAPLKLAEALQNGQHVAMLVDQYLTNGVEVTFFGRKTKANPMLARLLRQVDCPIHGTRIIRLPNNRFRAELSEEVKPVRDAARKSRHPGHDAGGHLGGRGLDPRISGAVAVAASQVAVALCPQSVSERDPSNAIPNSHARHLRRRAPSAMTSTSLRAQRRSGPCAAMTLARNDGGDTYLPVFTRVHSRLMTRWVAGSRAVMTNSFFDAWLRPDRCSCR